MSSFKIFYPQDNGTVAIVVPVDGVTESKALESVPLGKQYIVITDDSIIPTDRIIQRRMGSRFYGGRYQIMITVNMTKAREIKKDHLRQERKPLLEKLDVQYMRAIEAGATDEQASIATKKQQLTGS